MASRELPYSIDPVDGGYFYNDGGNMPFDYSTLEKLQNDAVAITKTCGLSILDETESVDPTAWISYLKQVASPCSASQEANFVSAMQDFATCSGFDFLEFMESSPSALVGTLLTCALDLVSNSDPLAILMTGEIPALPESCMNAAYGPNPFGKMLHQMALYPDKTLPCFSTLSSSLPSCKYEMWPIPMVGDWVKKVSCMLGASTDLLEDTCEAGLKALTQCMPSDIKKSDCSAITAQSCVGGAVLFGMPLPDTCVRISKERGLQTAVALYDEFQNTCAPVVWDGWNEKVSQGSNNNAAVASSTSFMAVPASQGNQKFGNFAGPFIIGAAVGILIMALISFLRDRSKNYTQTGTFRKESEMIVSYKDNSII